MATLQELKRQIENANALGIKNLADKGVGFAGFPPTTYEIMQGIADIVRDGGDDSGGGIQYTSVTFNDDDTISLVDSEGNPHTMSCIYEGDRLKTVTYDGSEVSLTYTGENLTKIGSTEIDLSGLFEARETVWEDVLQFEVSEDIDGMYQAKTSIDTSKLKTGLYSLRVGDTYQDVVLNAVPERDGVKAFGISIITDAEIEVTDYYIMQLGDDTFFYSTNGESAEFELIKSNKFTPYGMYIPLNVGNGNYYMDWYTRIRIFNNCPSGDANVVVYADGAVIVDDTISFVNDVGNSYHESGKLSEIATAVNNGKSIVVVITQTDVDGKEVTTRIEGKPTIKSPSWLNGDTFYYWGTVNISYPD